MVTSYHVHGKVVEHTDEPRFQAVVHPRDGLCFTITEVEWIDSPRSLTATHKSFLLHLALLAWANENDQPLA